MPAETEVTAVPQDKPKIEGNISLLIGEIGELKAGDEFFDNPKVKSFEKKPGCRIAVAEIVDLGKKSKHQMGPVVLSAEDADNRWKALEGMPVHADVNSGFAHHWDAQSGNRTSIGVHIATCTEKRKGGKVRVRAAMALWENDFPDIVAALHAFRPQMGASYEVQIDYDDEEDAVTYGDDGVTYINHYTPVGSALVRRDAAAHPQLKLLAADEDGSKTTVSASDVTKSADEPVVGDPGAASTATSGSSGGSSVRRQTRTAKKGGKVELLDSILQKLPEDERELASTVLDRVVADRVSAALQEKIVPLNEKIGTLQGERDSFEQEKASLQAELEARKTKEDEARVTLAVASKVDEWVKSGKYREEDKDKLTPIAAKLIAGEALASGEAETLIDLKRSEGEPLTTITADGDGIVSPNPRTAEAVDAARRTLQSKGMIDRKRE